MAEVWHGDACDSQASLLILSHSNFLTFALVYAQSKMAEALDKKSNVVKAEEAPKAPQQAKDDIASDPEEDDLSDLDDVLDEFSNVNLRSESKVPSAPAPASSGPGRPEAPALDPAEALVEDQNEFEKELQKQMEQLLGQEGFPKEFQDLMKEMGNAVGEDDLVAGAGVAGAAAPIASSSKAEGEAEAKGEQTFQESIRKTMERMRESGDAAGAAAAKSSDDDILAQMLKEMESGNLGGEGGEEDFSKILMGMMEQLTNKEILYEPMKELNDKFPDWMEKNKGKVDAVDWKRYEEQQTLVKEITDRFERNGYSDENAEDREYIVERMQKMQAAGSPPPDLVGDMNAAQEAFSEMDQGCPTQ
ncbi:Peroxisome chaperone and import receptor [Didymosphaeria variabile]|uniref:Peroxisome chaperone and import receptor n=1 Tax=Didymosphaeria variabile TaxID=1932322 RepID=A0A9W9CDD9_9PLEO|nr:Peroxisome chaperone and import receptor [Didymosphaeria variabile]KAJ4357651.1 Peroxisome chaperone and import receptor [Didymosphaeria variabile]